MSNADKPAYPTLLTRLANRLSEMEGKSETVKELAKAFDCPYTSLYIPVRQLEDAGFLKLKRGTGVIVYGADALIEELQKQKQ